MSRPAQQRWSIEVVAAFKSNGLCNKDNLLKITITYILFTYHDYSFSPFQESGRFYMDDTAFFIVAAIYLDSDDAPWLLSPYDFYSGKELAFIISSLRARGGKERKTN